MAKLTQAQRNFLTRIKPHVDYRTVGKFAATAKRLESQGFVEIFDNGYFARITAAGRAALTEGKDE